MQTQNAGPLYALTVLNLLFDPSLLRTNAGLTSKDLAEAIVAEAKALQQAANGPGRTLQLIADCLRERCVEAGIPQPDVDELTKGLAVAWFALLGTTPTIGGQSLS